MTTYQQWYDRIQNLLDVQKALYLDTIQTSFTRRDLIELKLIIDTLMVLIEEREKDEQTKEKISAD